MVDTNIHKLLLSLLAFTGLGLPLQSFACGGLFCDTIPINQAAEQIIFKQQGSETTAMIKIDYVGNAEDFGWVLPVPEDPEISLGSDTTFTELELSTRPQFLLTRTGESCLQFIAVSAVSGGGNSSSSSSSSSSGSTVVIEKTLSIGAFDAQIVSSDDPEALALWLTQNNLDLTDKGGELLAPYIQQKSKFVVLKLKNNASAGSIQPIILKYQSNTPVIPMTLTAVAAQSDMGVLVWLLGDGRGVPENFKHVIPNYTRLNWFSSTQAAYASYQGLITQAMDEAGGQGFATDFAGYMPSLTEQLSNAQRWVDFLAGLEGVSDATFIAKAWDELNGLVQSTIRSALPTSNTFIYQQATSLPELFTAEELKQARSEVSKTIQEQIIEPLNNGIDLLDDNLYLTRLYTTLSADEMNTNPQFTFNTAMEDQQLTRNAAMNMSCVDGQTHWTLTLGKGTGRADELVIDAWEPVPFFGTPVAALQPASFRVEKTSAIADPIVLAQNNIGVARLGTFTASNSSTSSSSSSSASSSSSGSGLGVNPADPDVTVPVKTTKKSGGSSDYLLLLMIGFLGLGRRIKISK